MAPPSERLSEARPSPTVATGSAAERRGPGWGLARKLFLAQLLVIVAGSATLLLVALTVAPGLFREHVREALGVVPPDVARHLDEAFDEAVLVSLAVAVAAAAAAAAAAAWFLTRRIVRPVSQLANAAGRMARGGYGERVPVSGADELAQLAWSFNELAASLESAELRRRQLLADLAHELRTPLATIEGYLEGVRDGVVPGDTATWAVLETELRRLHRLVDDLRAVTRAEQRVDLRLRSLTAAELVSAAVRAAAHRYAAKGVTLSSDVAGRPPKLAVDPDRLGEVLANLLDNALRHTPPGGRVHVRAARVGPSLEVAVEDSGEGIGPEHLGRVFERFYRVDRGRTRGRGGSGIGLAVARALVLAHGGTIRAESAGPGQGATFVITLPLAGARPAAAGPGDRPGREG